MNKECINFTFDPRGMLLSVQTVFIFVRAEVACAFHERTSGFEPSSETTVLRDLKLDAVPSFYLFILIGTWMPLALFVIISVFSALISTLYLVQVLSSLLTRPSGFWSSSARALVSSTNRRLVMSLPPMITFPLCSSRALYSIRSRKKLKTVGDRKRHCYTPSVVLNASLQVLF